MIPFIAIVFGGGMAASEVGVGAILGAPFMLSTLAMFVTGAAVLLMRRRRASGEDLAVDTGVLGHDMAYFAVAYAIAIGAAFLPVEFEWPRRLTAVVLLGVYACYVLGHLRAEAAAHENLEPLRFHKLDRRAPQHPEPPRLLHRRLSRSSSRWSASSAGPGASSAPSRTSPPRSASTATLLALVIAPLATELPEKLNSVLWVSRGKDTLAMGNITGAMVFQSAIPDVRRACSCAGALVGRRRRARLRVGRDHVRLLRRGDPADARAPASGRRGRC